jgi:hypothetical protein
VRREQVVEVLRAALEPLAFVNAAWLGGSDAFGRADELSDVDLQVDVDNGQVAATFAAAGLVTASRPADGSCGPAPAQCGCVDMPGNG